MNFKKMASNNLQTRRKGEGFNNYNLPLRLKSLETARISTGKFLSFKLNNKGQKVLEAQEGTITLSGEYT